MKTAKRTTLAAPASVRNGNHDQPAWKVAELLPAQGSWSEDAYLSLIDLLENHKRVELYDGRLEFLPMPTQWHQIILKYLFNLLEIHIEQSAPGLALFSSFKIRLSERKGKKPQYREPDIVYMKQENAHRRHESHWDGADLVVEIVSGSAEDHKRDYEEKRREYAAARIPEYWLIDPEKELMRVMTLKGTTYRVHGDFTRGQEAISVLLPGFVVPVCEMLDSRR